jgi:cytochrome b pre-mRNA-processing protein 3
MRSTAICSECLQALRRPMRVAASAKQFRSHTRPTSARPLSTTGAQKREETQKETGVAQASQDLSPNSGGPTVAQMQEAIRTELQQQSPVGRLAQSLLKNAPSATQTYVVYGTTERLFQSCGAQAPYTIPEGQRTQVLTGQGPPKTDQGEDIGIPDATSTVAGAGSVFWHEQLGMLPTFSTWSHVTYLHFYILLVHMRTLSSYSSLQMYQRYLIEHFSQNAEDKMVLLHIIEARGIRNRYLKDLFVQWRGCITAYDEGMVKGDAVLGGAVWRNLFKGEEQVDWEKVAVVVAYMRRCINLLGEYETIEDVAGSLNGPEGIWARAQQGLFAEVQQPSQGMREVFEASS